MSVTGSGAGPLSTPSGANGRPSSWAWGGAARCRPLPGAERQCGASLRPVSPHSLAMAAGSEEVPERLYELVVFGASGFTGQFVVEEVARTASGGELRGPLRWAVAGRNRNKLQEVLERAAERLGTDCGRVARGEAGRGGGRRPGQRAGDVTAVFVRRESGAGSGGRRAAVRCGRPGVAGRYGEADPGSAQLRGPGECWDLPCDGDPPTFQCCNAWKDLAEELDFILFIVERHRKKSLVSQRGVLVYARRCKWCSGWK